MEISPNEFLIFLTAILTTAFIWGAWKIDKERLYGIIVIFLILIATVGGKIIPIFGYETTTGNIFYASVFLATYFLIERHGIKEGRRSMWLGVLGATFFSLLAGITILLKGSPITTELNTHLSEVFTSAPRLVFACLFSYLLSQSVNINLYVWLKQRFDGTKLWLRANIANAIAQALDSALFFSLAFTGVIPPQNILEILLTGYVIKVLYMMLASPILYVNRIEHDDDTDTSVIYG